jgi:uncharacterized protein (TIGR00369 family)
MIGSFRDMDLKSIGHSRPEFSARSSLLDKPRLCASMDGLARAIGDGETIRTVAPNGRVLISCSLPADAPLVSFICLQATWEESAMTEIDYTSAELIERERQGLFAFTKDFPFFKLMGIELVEIEPGRAIMQMSYRDDLCQPAGIMHGGAIASLVDTSIAHSILLTPRYLEAKAHGALIVSVDLRIKYLRPVSAGRVICEARAPRVGRQITHTSAVVTDPSGRELAQGDSIYMIVHGEHGRKRAVDK